MALKSDILSTDPDTSAYRAAEEFYGNGLSRTEPEHLLDTRHLCENVRKKIKNDPKVVQIMPGRTKAEREKLCGRFSLDLTFRCTAEREQAGKKYGNNFNKIKSAISYIVDAIVSCYRGNHDKCKKYSYVCKGGPNNWISRSTFLRPDFAVAGRSSKRILRDCVNLRLGRAMLEKTKFNTTSNKSESVNKILRRSVPRHTNFSSVFSGRCHSGVHASNHGPGESIVKLCEGAGCPIVPGSSVAKCLQAEQKKYEQRKAYNACEENIIAKCEKRRVLFQLYEDLQESVDYEKGQLLAKTWSEQSNWKKYEHAYAKKSKLKQRNTH